MKSQKEKHEIKVNLDHDNTRKATEPKNHDLGHDKTRKTIKPKHSLRAENKRIRELEQAIETIEQKAITQIQQQDFNKALQDVEKETMKISARGMLSSQNKKPVRKTS